MFCSLALLAGTARAVGGSTGRIELSVTMEYSLEGFPGKHKVSAAGFDMPLTVGLDKNDILSIGGSYSSLTKPFTAQVNVPCDAQFLIGGITQRKATTKVPVLGDIPILGGMFRTEDRMKDQINLAILITPTVWSPPKAATFVEIGGPIDLDKGSMKGSSKIDGTFQHYTGGYTLKFDGLIQSGPNAGKRCKGSLKYKFTGERT